MNRKLGTLIKAAVFALPLALPGVALAQSYDNADKQNAPMDTDKAPDKNVQPEGVTPPSGEEKTPPAGSLDTSGTAKPSERGAGGDINKMPEGSQGSSETKTTKTKKSIKKSTTTSPSDTNPSPSDTNPSNPSDLNH
jgi:hypothetical protein